MWNFTFIEEINVKTFITEHDVYLFGSKFRFLQTCHSYNESATVSFKVSFQFLVLVVSRTLVVLVY